MNNLAGSALVLTMAGVASAPIGVSENALPSLPFSVTVPEEKFDNVPDYMCARNPDGHMDYHCGPVMIDGEYWIIYKNGNGPNVYRFLRQCPCLDRRSD